MNSKINFKMNKTNKKRKILIFSLSTKMYTGLSKLEKSIKKTIRKKNHNNFQSPKNNNQNYLRNNYFQSSKIKLN